MIKATKSNMKLTGTKFSLNYAFEGGAIQIDNNAFLRADNIIAEGNYAVKSGGVI